MHSLQVTSKVHKLQCHSSLQLWPHPLLYAKQEQVNLIHQHLWSTLCRMQRRNKCSQLTHNKSCTRKEQHVNELVAPAPDPFHARPPQQQLELLGHPRDAAVAPLLTPEGRSEKAHHAMPCTSDSQVTCFCFAYNRG